MKEDRRQVLKRLLEVVKTEKYLVQGDCYYFEYGPGGELRVTIDGDRYDRLGRIYNVRIERLRRLIAEMS